MSTAAIVQRVTLVDPYFDEQRAVMTSGPLHPSQVAERTKSLELPIHRRREEMEKKYGPNIFVHPMPR